MIVKFEDEKYLREHCLKNFFDVLKTKSDIFIKTEDLLIKFRSIEFYRFQQIKFSVVAALAFSFLDSLIIVQVC